MVTLIEKIPDYHERDIKACAIDPGVGGGIAVWLQDRETTEYMAVPVRVADWTMRDYIEWFSLHSIRIPVMMEKVGPRPHDGRAALWTFATNVATWHMAMVATETPFFEITSVKWQQKLMGVTLPREYQAKKKALKEFAERRFPETSVYKWNADCLAMLTVYREFQ